LVRKSLNPRQPFYYEYGHAHLSKAAWDARSERSQIYGSELDNPVSTSATLRSIISHPLGLACYPHNRHDHGDYYLPTAMAIDIIIAIKPPAFSMIQDWVEAGLPVSHPPNSLDSVSPD